MMHLSAAEAALFTRASADPLLLLHTAVATANARDIVSAFPGTVAYAVKVCDRPEILRALVDGGVREWDVASIHEIATVRSVMPGAVVHFMNPVKSREHVAHAYDQGVRTFAFDSEAELRKIAAVTGGDRAVLPVLRLAVPNDGARLPIDSKFGCSEDEAEHLARTALGMGYRYGLTFHVGSQCEDVTAWARAVDMVCRVAVKVGTPPHMVDIGGGFPARYRGSEPAFAACVAAARHALDRALPGFRGIFQCEPGRVLAAPAASALVRVELRKGNALFLNEGYYGLLAELKWMTATHPVRRIGDRGGAPLAPFSFFGPSCDSVDAMEGPYWLPADMDEGDWIEVGQLGAYSTVLSTRFNGFPECRTVLADMAGTLLLAA